MCKSTSPDSQVLVPQVIVGWFYFILVYYCYCYHYYYYYCLFVFSFSFFLVWIVVLAVAGLFVGVCFQFCLVVVIVLGCFWFCFLSRLFVFFYKGGCVSIQWGQGRSEVIIFCWSVDWFFLFWNCIWLCSVAGKFGCN